MDSRGLLAQSSSYSGLPLARHRHGHPRKTTPTSIPLPKPSTATTYTTATVQPLEPCHDNIDAFSSTDSLLAKHKDSLDIVASRLPGKSKLTSKPKPLSSLPRSRTLSVLTNLTSSLSRSSSRVTSFASNTSSTNNTINASLRQPSISSTTASQIEPPVPNPRLIHEAQSSEAWTGRFVRLQDRFQSEMLQPENLTTLVTVHAERSRASKRASQPEPGMSTSASNPNMSLSKSGGHKYLSSMSTNASKHSSRVTDAELLENEDNRARRVFLHLEALCTTTEAKRSLYLWQQSYARRMGQDCLLPRCAATVEDKSWMGRILGRGELVAKRSSVISVA